jgi:predicted P-loop ATPase
MPVIPFKPAAQDDDPLGEREPDWRAELLLTDKGEVAPLLHNLVVYLLRHPQWEHVFAYDEFACRVTVCRPLPWGEEPPEGWTDHHDTLTRIWFQREGLNATKGDCGRAIQAAARGQSFHPVRDYLGALVWDGTKRNPTWLHTYLRAEDTRYTRAIGPRFLISAVARIFIPGCQADYSIVLEGPQGKHKSDALRALAVKDEWFTDRLSHLSSKDAAIEVAGVWLIELSELDAITSATSSAAKSFLTRRDDRFRVPYGIHAERHLRQSVMAGTVNPTSGGYLKDPTGARRIWPFFCEGDIDVEAIVRDRDQLWAEAVVQFQAGAPWHLETPELEALATAEQALRYKEDAWKVPIMRWIGKRSSVGVSEVLLMALHIAENDQSQSAQTRVAHILTHLGFTKVRTNKGGAPRENRYQRAPIS